MTIDEYITVVANSKPGGTIRLGKPETAAWPIAVGKPDQLAAQLLQWMLDCRPDATYGELSDILRAAEWWLTLYEATITAETADAMACHP